MSENIIQKLLERSFSRSDKDAWKQIAVSELNGHEHFNKLIWNDNDGIKFLPYYSSDDISQLSYLENFNQPPLKNSFLGNRIWSNLPAVTVDDESLANKKVLDHLINGADGILFDLTKNNNPDLKLLLQDVEWQHCTLSFQRISNDNIISSLESHIIKNNIEFSAIKGNLFWDNASHLQNSKVLSACENFNTHACFINSSTPVKEISEALLSGLKMIELNQVESIEKILQNISFSLPVNTNFLEDLCKLKALRVLWYQIAQAYEIKNFSPEDLHIHARSESWQHEKFQPHANMLKSTTAAMAAIIGGCDSLTIFPEDENNFVMDRNARNVSNILREESHLHKVADPFAGAYTIAIMVDEMAQQAWRMVQSTLTK